jgi:tetratricopeptide (TPR) repeat protein
MRKARSSTGCYANRAGIARNYGNLGCLYGTRGDLTRAEEMCRKALTLYEKLGANSEETANQYANLGLLREKKGDMAQACAFWRKARDLWRQIGNPGKVELVEGWLRGANGPAE